MQFLAVAALLLATSTSAVPTTNASAATVYEPCPVGGLYGNPECCAFDLIAVAAGDCQSPSRTPVDAADFQAICAETGQRARCCVAAEVADLGAFCEKPVGVTD